MSVQVYLRWDGMSQEDRDNQDYMAGPEAEEGRAGFLHDFNRPNATSFLIPEGWSSQEYEVRVPAFRLRERLPVAIFELYRSRETYCQDACRYCDPDNLRRLFHDSTYYPGPNSPLSCGVVDRSAAFIEFVTAVERLEREGRDPRIHVSW